MHEKRNIQIIEWEDLDKGSSTLSGCSMTMRHPGHRQAYITTYELVRKYVSQYSDDNTFKSLVAGGSASLVAQSITVPIDVVSQQLMMQGQGEHLTRFRLNADRDMWHLCSPISQTVLSGGLFIIFMLSLNWLPVTALI
ncbi:hypothetical protein KUCAC02_002402 [Chaenocephalus aceratus]|uniref:Uncharacterized protein n=1 Tax=Chaenocephalus aceratus TaxID=36190 RepID=A0ACB9XVP0_CHAAC|nr:hypothetical protein KUCAC02_002402 [Chaenocephalus aceratus]